jgi:hypothetical protein
VHKKRTMNNESVNGMRDTIKFSNYMNMCRNSANVSLQCLGRGLYTPSMMARIERGESLPDYRMRNRIMSRLGIASDGNDGRAETIGTVIRPR